MKFSWMLVFSLFISCNAMCGEASWKFSSITKESSGWKSSENDASVTIDGDRITILAGDVKYAGKIEGDKIYDVLQQSKKIDNFPQMLIPHFSGTRYYIHPQSMEGAPPPEVTERIQLMNGRSFLSIERKIPEKKIQ